MSKVHKDDVKVENTAPELSKKFIYAPPEVKVIPA